MGLTQPKLFLELRATEESEHSFVLAVTASNLYFSGITKVSEDASSLKKFADLLLGFPNSMDVKPIEYNRASGMASYYSMKFYCVGKMGHVAVKVAMARNIGDFDSQENDKMEIEIIVDPASIDSFQKQLVNLAKYKTGSATLNGREDSPLS